MSLQKQTAFEELKREAHEDTQLPLRETANNLVLGHGSLNSEIIFIGEAPGKNEDLLGLPFIGAAGKVLDKLLQSINLKREDVFISSVIHYRPPKNRQPKPSEIKAFEKYIDGIIEIINPKIIATLGNFSLNKFLPGQKISDVHGKPQEIIFQGKKYILIPLYHPAAVLYKRTLEKDLENDFKEIRKQLNSKSRLPLR